MQIIRLVCEGPRAAWHWYLASMAWLYTERWCHCLGLACTRPRWHQQLLVNVSAAVFWHYELQLRSVLCVLWVKQAAACSHCDFSTVEYVKAQLPVPMRQSLNLTTSSWWRHAHPCHSIIILKGALWCFLVNKLTVNITIFLLTEMHCV